jgi:TetR/AcrR family transcriptional regulator, cholesterol catabolism regulator
MPRLSKVRKELLTTMMKEAIFKAAASVFCKHGEQGTTMNRVAEAANLAKSSLYDYFESKEELLQFIRSRLVEPCFQAIEEISNADLPVLQKLEKILRTAWEHAVQNKGLIQLVSGVDHGSQVKRDVRPRFMKILKTVFEQGIREGVFRLHNPAMTSRLFLGCLSELFELQAEGASSEEVDEYVGMLLDAVVNGFSIHIIKEEI